MYLYYVSVWYKANQVTVKLENSWYIEVGLLVNLIILLVNLIILLVNLIILIVNLIILLVNLIILLVNLIILLVNETILLWNQIILLVKKLILHFKWGLIFNFMYFLWHTCVLCVLITINYVTVCLYICIRNYTRIIWVDFPFVLMYLHSADWTCFAIYN